MLKYVQITVILKYCYIRSKHTTFYNYSWPVTKVVFIAGTTVYLMGGVKQAVGTASNIQNIQILNLNNKIICY